MAIAFHADPSADAVLERFLAAGQPLELRKQAAFWMGQARGERGYQALKRVLREDEDRRLREHAIFALTQSHEPGAVDAIIETARRDPRRARSGPGPLLARPDRLAPGVRLRSAPLSTTTPRSR